MIAVIADDITGAAELGGIGLRHRLKTEIRTVVDTHTRADLLVIATDTRSKPVADAVAEMAMLTRQLKALGPTFIYKKADSVLRGHVIAELEAQLDVLGYSRALLIPANPALGRTIQDGHYYLHGKPVHESAFAVDPDFPVTSSHVPSMLRAPIAVHRLEEGLPERGIVVGEVADSDDLHAWAGLVKEGMLLAGASGFFSALLDEWKINGMKRPRHSVFGKPALYVSGTTFNPLPSDADPLEALARKGKAMISAPVERGLAEEIRRDLALKVKATMATAPEVAELLIEGGSTAFAVLEELGFHAFVPEEELATGVIRMSVPEAPWIHITLKPGSYPWPAGIQY